MIDRGYRSFNDEFAFGFELLEICRLMLQAFLLQKLACGNGLGLVHILNHCQLHIKEALMVTLQKGDQVRWWVENVHVTVLLYAPVL